MTNGPESSRGDRRGSRTFPAVRVGFWAVVLLLVVWGSWGGSFYNSDEVIYLQMAREMNRTGNYLDLQYMGEVIHQRPPLAIWFLAAADAAAPGNLFVLRLPSMAMGLVLLVLLFLVGRRLLRDERAAMLAVLLLLGAHVFYLNMRSPMTDTTHLAGAAFALYAWLRGRDDRRWLPAVGIGLGWVLMTKHALVAVPSAVILADLFLSRRLGLLREWRLWLAAGITVALALPWHLAQTVRHGAAFWQEYIGFNVLQRASASLFHTPDVLYYPRQLLAFEGILPWLYAVGLAALLWRLVRRREAEDLFLLAWFLAAFLPFQAASTRLYHYLIPTLLPLSLLVARSAREVLGRPLLLGLALLAALGIFFTNNDYNLLEADYSPDQRAFAQRIREEGRPGAEVRSFNVYELVLFYDLDVPVKMLSSDERFFRIVDGAPIMHRAQAIDFVPAADAAGVLARGPGHWIARFEDLPALCGSRGERCGPAGPFRVVEGLQHVLVSNALR